MEPFLGNDENRVAVLVILGFRLGENIVAQDVPGSSPVSGDSGGRIRGAVVLVGFRDSAGAVVQIFGYQPAGREGFDDLPAMGIPGVGLHGVVGQTSIIGIDAVNIAPVDSALVVEGAGPLGAQGCCARPGRQ